MTTENLNRTLAADDMIEPPVESTLALFLAMRPIFSAALFVAAFVAEGHFDSPHLRRWIERARLPVLTGGLF